MTATTADTITAPPARPIAAPTRSAPRRTSWWIAPAAILGVLFWVWVFDAALQWIGV